MKDVDIIHRRLINQQIAKPAPESPAEALRWMVAMQAQEFAHAKWAIALRCQKHLTDADVEGAFNKGAILRTHLMRPTWHFVTPEDIHWLLALTAPRVHAVNKYWYSKFGVTPKLRKRSEVILERSLQGGQHLTRVELNTIFRKHKIVADGLQLGYIMMHAELEGLICSGPRKGKQFTYALLGERAPRKDKVSIEEALDRFVKRYLASRGPASADDFAYWSGLTLKDARAGFDAVKGEFERCDINGKEYFFPAESTSWKKSFNATFVMPDYDEYGMSYKDRQAIALPEKQIISKDRSLYNHWLVIDGRIAGSWKQATVKNKTEVMPVFFTALSSSAKKKMDKAITRFISFHH